MRKWNKRLLSGCLLAALLLSMSGCQQGNTTSSAVSSQAVSSAAASSEETTEGPVETYHDMPVQTLDLDPSDPDYYQKALETELYNYKLIRNVPTAYQAARLAQKSMAMVRSCTSTFISRFSFCKKIGTATIRCRLRYPFSFGCLM